jgi:hypothetical protein
VDQVDQRLFDCPACSGPSRSRAQVKEEVPSVESGLDQNVWMQDIQGARMIPVLIQYVEIHQRLEAIIHHSGVEDRWVWRWTARGTYSTSSAYSTLCLGQSSIAGAKELWKLRALSKCCFFLWTVLHGRTWMAERLFRHGLRNDDTCALWS